MADACLAPCVVDPAPSGGRALRLSSCHTQIACHGRAASPVVGRAVYALVPEVSFSCPLMLLRSANLADMSGFILKKKKKDGTILPLAGCCPSTANAWPIHTSACPKPFGRWHVRVLNTRIACHGKAASPVVGRAVYAFIPEVSFSCPLILLRWQIWLTCKASSYQKKKKEKKNDDGLIDEHNRVPQL